MQHDDLYVCVMKTCLQHHQIISSSTDEWVIPASPHWLL